MTEEEKKLERKSCPFGSNTVENAWCSEECELWLSDGQMCCVKFACIMLGMSVTPIDLMAQLKDDKPKGEKTPLQKEMDIFARVMQQAKGDNVSLKKESE